MRTPLFDPDTPIDGLTARLDVRRKLWKPLLAVFLAVVVLASLIVLGLSFYWAARNPQPQGRVAGDGVADGRAQPPDSPEMLLCYQFRNRKNAGDPAADLLGPAPAIPAAPVSPEEADRLQTEFFLRQNLRIVGVGWDAQRKKPVLFTQGNVSAPTLRVRTGAGVETAQRTMSNPDLVVEVRDGRLYGLAAHVHW